jgi:hypothetical protein
MCQAKKLSVLLGHFYGLELLPVKKNNKEKKAGQFITPYPHVTLYVSPYIINVSLYQLQPFVLFSI